MFQGNKCTRELREPAEFPPEKHDEHDTRAICVQDKGNKRAGERFFMALSAAFFP